MLKRTILIATVAVFFIVGCPGIDKDNIDRIKNIKPYDVKRIEIYEKMIQYKHKNRKILEINQSFEIQGFLKSFRSFEIVDPNHPQFPNRWLIRIEYKDTSKQAEEIQIFLRRRYSNRLYLEFPSDGFFGEMGYAVSHELYDWLKDKIDTNLR